jgi:hypothetical protein
MSEKGLLFMADADLEAETVENIALLREAAVVIEGLAEKLRISYPMTPVDCFLSDLQELTILTSLEDAHSVKNWIRSRCRQFRHELEDEPWAK